ncbi:MAG TPA: Bax inhibitor-1/YccA family protein [Tepidisphaeraceae bacterium]|nr:Bax inhibitor-1/YccA family protein [Tepidisphaeraceae bacterium]
MSMFPDSSTTRRVGLEYSTEDRALFSFFNTVYAWMAVGLALTGVVAYGVSTYHPLLRLVNGPLGMIIGLGAFIIAIAAQGVAMRIGAAAGTALYLLYAALIGVLISAIFAIYPMVTLGSAFLLTAGTFAGLSVYGFITKRDLTRIGSILVMCVWGLILATIVNYFVASTAFSWLLTYAILAVFIGLTVYYTQYLKNFALANINSPDMLSRVAVVGSLLLYAAFLNLFLSILRIMGDRR